MATKTAKRRRTTRVASRKHWYLEDKVDAIHRYTGENYDWCVAVLRWSRWVNRQLGRDPAHSEEVPPVPVWPKNPPKPKGITR